MISLPKNSPYFTAATTPRVEFMRGASSVRVSVDDAGLRRAGLDGFDGLEKAFALMPHNLPGGQVTWSKVDLGYEQTVKGRDVHAAYPAVDANAVREHGFAVGLETNQGTVWLQKPDDNWKTIAFGPTPDELG